MLGCVLLGLPDGAQAETLTVGKGGLDTIQAAVDAALGNADAEDTINVPPGDYTETVTIDYTATAQTGLVLKRAGKKGKVNLTGVSGVALSIAAASNVQVTNFTVQSSSAADGTPAILINTCRNLIFTKVNGVAGDDSGVVISNVNSIGVRFENCNFSGMLGIAFLVDGFGHEFRRCKADGAGLNAFVLTTQALDCWIIESSAVGAGGSFPTHPGMITLRGNGHRLLDTEIGGSGLNGVYAVGAGHVLERCSSDGNAQAGFLLDEAQALLENCSASGNANGMEGGSLGATILGGSYSGNTANGLRISEGGTNVRGVKASHNGQHGIHVINTVAGTNIRDCTFSKNGGEGVQVDGSLTWMEGNLAKGGDGLVDAGTNNSGRDNEAPAEAVNDF